MSRDILPHVSRIQRVWNTSQQRYYIPTQSSNTTQENLRYSAETLVARRLAWIGDQIELRRISAGHAGNVPRLIGRSLAAAGDVLDCRYKPLARRNETILRLFWRCFSYQEDAGLVFAGAMLQVTYLVLQQVSRNMLL